MKRAKFDSICKDLLFDLASYLGFEALTQFYIDPQKRIEKLLGFVEKRDNTHKSSVDVVWNTKLPEYGTTFFAKKFFADVVIAWEVDNSSNTLKSIKTSIENLDRLNPRLGIELLLIGTNKKAIESFPVTFRNAVDASREKSRIIVIHDVNFANLYNSITGRHPEQLYNEYIDICKKNPEIASALKERLEDLLRTSKLEYSGFKKEFYEKFLDKLTDN